MKHALALLVIAALLGGCSKTSSTSTDQATAAAADEPSAAAAANSASAAASPIASSTQAAAGAGTASVVPVYPGSTRNAGQSGSYSDNGALTKVDYYNTKDDGPTVANWFSTHLPSDWSRDMGAPGKKIAGVFTSPDESQSVMVTGDASGTEVQVSVKGASN
jgi:hypothetical protein